MHQALQILATLLVAVGMALSLAHALELPGKLRLPKETYIAVQSIYYPGFTIGGMFGEFGAMLATLVLLIFTPSSSTAFWLTLAAFVALLIMHGLYWLVTHPVNKFWLKDQQMQGAGAAFFRVGGRGSSRTDDADWSTLRDRWEYSHVARAVCATFSLIALVTAAAL
jgi:Anthrone oxygenase